MKLVDNILYLEFQELVSAGVSSKYLKKAKSVGTRCWNFINDPIDKRRVLIQYDTLKPEYKRKVRERFASVQGCSCEDRGSCEHGDVYAWYRNNSLSLHLETDQKATDFFNTKKIATANGIEGLSDAHKTKYINDAKILNLLIKYRDGSKAFRRSFGMSRLEFYDSVCAYIKGLKSEGKSDLPTSYRRLIQEGGAIDRYEKESYASLISWRFNNQNTARLTDIHIETIKALMMDEYGRKFTYHAIYQQFLYVARENNWQTLFTPKPISEKRVFDVIKSLENTWFLARNGYKHFLNEKEFTISRERTSEPNLEWQIDGTPETLWYYDDDRKVVDKLYVLKAMDSHSRKIVGYSIGYTETSHLVFEAVKMGCLFNQVIPSSIRYDRGSAMMAGETQSFFDRMGCLHFPAQSGRARAKSIEPWQNHMNQVIYTWYANKSGGNVDAKSLNSKQNPETFKKYAKQFPRKEELISQIHLAFELWDEMPGDDKLTPNQRYADDQPRRRDLKTENIVDLFYVWRKNGKKLQGYEYKQDGLTVQVKKRQFKYLPVHITPLELAVFQNTHTNTTKFYVKYDPSDMNMIALYTLPEGYALEEKNMRFEGFASIKQLVKESMLDMDKDNRQLYEHFRKVQSLQSELLRKQEEEIKQTLRDKNILSGAIELEKVHKDIYNRAKINLQRKQAMGYASTIILSDEHERQSAKETKRKKDIYDEEYAVPVDAETKPQKSRKRDIYDD